jgi:aryl-alcohol dehydrogenase-like predicted oxidoreductase
MDELVAAGKIRYWGVSIGTKETVEIARRAMAWPSTASIQIICNLFHRSILEDLREEIRARKIGVVARAPLEYGLLTGKFSPQTRFPASDQRSWRWTPNEFSRRLGQVETLCARLGSGRLSPAQVAIGFVLSYSEVSVVICGAKRPSQVEENAATSDLWAEALTEAELQSLRTVISP